MNRIKLNEYLCLDEIVDPFTYFTEPDNGLSKIDPNIPKIFKLLRELHGSPIKINQWWKHLPTDFKDFDAHIFLKQCIAINCPVWSGYRSELCTIGASKSAHKLGKAIDPKGDEKALFKIVTDNAKAFYDLGLKRLEDIKITNGWLHMDTETRGFIKNKIRVIDRTSHVGDINILTNQYETSI